MSFQAYLDAVEDKTGLTPRQLVDLAHERGFDETTKATPILESGSGTTTASAAGTAWRWSTSSRRVRRSRRSTWVGRLAPRRLGHAVARRQGDPAGLTPGALGTAVPGPHAGARRRPGRASSGTGVRCRSGDERGQSVQRWASVWLQVQSWTFWPSRSGAPPWASRHLPDCGLRSALVAESYVHFCAPVPLHV